VVRVRARSAVLVGDEVPSKSAGTSSTTTIGKFWWEDRVGLGRAVGLAPVGGPWLVLAGPARAGGPEELRQGTEHGTAWV
jgi:hypothetical protein